MVHSNKKRRKAYVDGCFSRFQGGRFKESSEWTQVTAREFITGKQAWKPKKKGISNSRVNKSAMRVFIETAAKDNDHSQKEVNVPHKPRKVKAFKKKAPGQRKKVYLI